MKMQLRDSNSNITNFLDQLKQKIMMLWVIRIEDYQYLKKLVKIMPELQEVIDHGGNTTHY
jgi:hypothetical protein